MPKNTGRGSRAAYIAQQRVACRGRPHSAEPVESVITGEVLAYICNRCLERCPAPIAELIDN